MYLKNSGLSTLALVCSLAVCAGRAEATNLFINGGFEAPRIWQQDPQQISPNDPAVLRLEPSWALLNSLPGWSLNPGFTYIELQHGALYNAPHLGQFAELDIDSPAGRASLVQGVHTEAGARYSLAGLYAVRPDIEWQDGFLTLNGRVAAEFGGRGNRFNDPFAVVQGQQHQLAYHPDAAPIFLPFYLEFVGTGFDVIGLGSLHTQTPGLGGIRSPAGGGNLFDNLSLLKIGDAPRPPSGEVPEPASILLLGSALLGAMKRRRLH